MKKITIALLGSINYDCITWAKRLPVPGETLKGYKNGFSPGGKGANQAAQAARMGAQTYMIGKVGDDAPGRILLESLSSHAVNTDYITVSDEVSTGTAMIYVSSCGENTILVAPEANDAITKSEVDAALPIIGNADIFLTQFETNMDIIAYAIEKAKSFGVPVILDPAPPAELNEGFFDGIDYVTPNETEALFYSGILPIADDSSSCHRCADYFLEKGVKNVILTLGKSGVFFKSVQRALLLPAYSIEAVDTTAAGDAWTAAFAVKIAQGEDIVSALIWGNAAGAVSAMHKGAQPSLGTANSIEEFMKGRTIVPVEM